MKIEKSVLEAAISRVKSLVPSKQQNPAMEGVLVKNGTMTAYNGMIGMTVRVEIPKDETMVMPAALLDLVPKLPDGSIELVRDADSSSILVRAGKTRTKIQCHAPSEFPELPKLSGDQGETELEGKELLKAIRHCLFAVATADTKPALTGMLLDAADGYLNFAASDAYRIARYRTASKGELHCIVPRQALQAIAGMRLDGKVKLTYTRRHAMVTTEDCTVVALLLEVDFIPDYNKLLEEKEHKVKCKADALLEALDRAIALSGTKVTRCVLQMTGSGIVVQNQSATSDYAELIPIETEEGVPVKELLIGFNANLLLDCLRTFKGETITFSYKEPLDPVALTAGELSVLCLPIRMTVEAKKNGKKQKKNEQNQAEQSEAA